MKGPSCNIHANATSRCKSLLWCCETSPDPCIKQCTHTKNQKLTFFKKKIQNTQPHRENWDEKEISKNKEPNPRMTKKGAAVKGTDTTNNKTVMRTKVRTLEQISSQSTVRKQILQLYFK